MISEDGAALDLDAYLRRIAYAGPREPTPPMLAELHLAHATHVPFENLDPLLGRPVRLDLGSLQAKLVRDWRGGYCFEQNTLFAAALEAFGFRVTRLAARVRLGTTIVRPRTHMLLKVDAGGEPWLADVGFGHAGLLRPIPLVPERPARQFLWTYRVVEEAGLLVLQLLRGGEWLDLYAFTTEPQYPVDYELANYFTSTHPDSIFVRTLTAQLPTPEARYALRGREFTVERGDGTSSRTVSGDEDMRQVLRGTFGIDLPPDDVARALRALQPIT